MEKWCRRKRKWGIMVEVRGGYCEEDGDRRMEIGASKELQLAV